MGKKTQLHKSLNWKEKKVYMSNNLTEAEIKLLKRQGRYSVCKYQGPSQD